MQAPGKQASRPPPPPPPVSRRAPVTKPVPAARLPATRTLPPRQNPPITTARPVTPQLGSRLGTRLRTPLPLPALPPRPAPAANSQLAAAPLAEERFSTPPPPPLNLGVPRVALLLPLSGPHRRLGQAMLNAAQLALFDFADQKFELLPQDTGGTAGGAADAMALAIGDGASLILGPLLASSVAAVAPAAQAAGIKVIAFSNDRKIAGDGIFAIGFLPAEEVRRVMDFAGSKGIRRIAALAPDNDYGQAIAESLLSAAEQVGAVITEMAFYPPETTDFAPIIRRLANYGQRRQNLLDQRRALKAREDDIAKQVLARLENRQTVGDVPFEALMIADGGKRLQAIAALLPYYDIDPKKIRMLGTGSWDMPGLGSEPALVGGWFAAPAPKDRAQFARQYNEIYGKKPPRLATLAYDATALAVVLAKGEGGIAMADLTAPQGFSGRDGIFRFLPEGVTQRGLSVLQVDERGTHVISQAPSNFDPVTN